jgi:hypothetical protein
MDEPALTPHAEHNRRIWDQYSDQYQSEHGQQLADSGGDAWGVWSPGPTIPETGS